MSCDYCRSFMSSQVFPLALTTVSWLFLGGQFLLLGPYIINKELTTLGGSFCQYMENENKWVMHLPHEETLWILLPPYPKQVETIGDAYMVVGGVPVPTGSHAQRVANFALGMRIAAKEVLNPITGEPIQVRNSCMLCLATNISDTKVEFSWPVLEVLSLLQ